MGLAASAWLLAAFFRDASSLLAARSREVAAVAAGLLASMVDFLAHGVVDNSYFVLDLALVFWLSVALLVVVRHERAAQGQTESAPPGRVVLRGEHG